ncbi:hypothetical protein [uncultured Reyranella sp.]|uniref:hypothetical protein n=1 Tax=uncultured Reyranella sp. TaxID=735512 RepID=UPI00259CE784|nr:hypothetical protein [uncultured Reyranella sp.]
MDAKPLGPLNPDLVEILGMPNFRAGPIAHLFVAAGEEKIEPAAETEQAFVLHWLLGLYLEHGSDWKPIASEKIRTMIAKVRAAKAAEAAAT